MTVHRRQLDPAASTTQQPSGLMAVTRQLSGPVRLACALIGTSMLGGGAVAVFRTSNELGSATLLVLGSLFALMAVLGHVPRFKWGGTEVDPGLYFAAGVAQGAEEVAEAAQGLLATSDEESDLGDALDAVTAEVTARELRRALSRTVTSAEDSTELQRTLDEWAQMLGVSRERVRQLRQRAKDLGLEQVPLDVVLNLGRLAAFNPSFDHHSVARELATLGFQAHAPQSRTDGSDAAYVRWLYQGPNRTVRLYQNSAGLISDSRPQLEFARRLDGAEPEGSVHPKVRFYYANSSVPTVLAVARQFRDFADHG